MDVLTAKASSIVIGCLAPQVSPFQPVRVTIPWMPIRGAKGPGLKSEPAAACIPASKNAMLCYPASFAHALQTGSACGRAISRRTLRVDEPPSTFSNATSAINSAAFTFPTPTPNGHAYTNIAMDQRYRAVSEIVANEKRSAAA